MDRFVTVSYSGMSIETSKPVVAMVSDFFYPGLGGVEMHIYQLSQCLLSLGYKVIVITHFRGNRHGVRYMTNGMTRDPKLSISFTGLKVYYLPYLSFHDHCTFPALCAFFPLIRNILIRERVDIVHGHQATSNLAHMALFHARTMGMTTVYTDHSLFGFGDAACIHINKVLKCMLSDVPQAICVSNTNKENLILRAAIRPEDVYVIPNAVDASRFTPEPSERPPPPRINIVVISRMTYRKGVDLLVDIIPAICSQYPDVHWLIGGDGPKRLDLEQLVERNKLHDRVELLGRIEHSRVRDVLVKGHIFLNCSLTEAFCIAIVEAASCGLSVVSTNVGGVPEVLPQHLIRLADPRADSLSEALSDVIQNMAPMNDPHEIHAQVREMYSWHKVALRTEKVYQAALKCRKLSFVDRMRVYLTVGPVAGILTVVFTVLDFAVWKLLEYIQPKESIEIASDFPIKRYQAQVREG